MFQSFRKASLAALAILAMTGPLRAEERVIADEPTTQEIIGDVLLARPAGLVATMVGTAVYLVALPFALLTDSEVTADKLVVEPANYTFVRPLGEDL